MGEPVLEIPFTGGIDEASREEHAQPGVGWVLLQNGRCNKRGAYEKRLAYAALGKTYIDATTRAAGYRMLMNGDQLCVIDGTNIDTYSPTAARSIVRGRVPECTVSLREAPSLGRSSYLEDVAYVNGYVVMSSYVSIVSGGTLYHGAVVIDETTGTVVSGPTTVDSSAALESIRLASYGNYAIAFTCDGTTSEVRAKYLDTTSAATINAGWQTLATFSDYNTGFDCANLTANDRVAIAFGADSNGADRITVKTLNIAGQIETVNITPGTALGGDDWMGVSLAESADTLWLAYFNNLTPTVVGLNPTDIDGTALASVLALTALSGVTPVNIYVCARSGSGKCNVYVHSVDVTAGASGYTMKVHPVQTSAGAAATDGALSTVGGAYMIARPFLHGGRIYSRFWSSPWSYDGLYEGVLCDCTTDTTVPYMRPVAVALHRGLHGAHSYGRCRSAPASATRYLSGIVVLQGGAVAGARLAEYDFADSDRWHSATLNNSTYLGGGVTSVFDGTRVFEAGFLTAPSRPQTDISVAGSLTLTNGRLYVCTYEHVDSDGNRHVGGASAPSTPISGAMTTQKVTVKTTPLAMTSRGDSTALARGAVRVRFWATLDSNNGEEPYYLVGEVVSDPSAMHVTFADEVSDTDLATYELLYGTGNLPGTGASQDHRAPPGMPFIASYNGMLVGAQGKDINHSSQPIDGEGPWFSPLFVKAIDGDATGITVRDGSFIIFTRRGAWICAGEPPSDNAYQGGLSTPRKLAVDFGCIDANSILETGIGTFYQSDRGIELLTRGLTSVFIGDKIQDTLATYPVVTSAVLDTTDGLARFSLTTARTAGLAATNGVDVVYDLALNVWISRDAKLGTVATQSSQDACMAYLSGAWRYCWLGTDGAVYYQRSTNDASAYLDTSTWVTQKAVSPWLHIAALQGEQFIDGVLMLAKQFTGHALTLSIAFDYVDSNTETQTWTRATLDTMAREWLHRGLTQTKGQAIRVTIEDATPSTGAVGTGRGAAWVALTLNGEPHRGPKRTASANRGTV